MEGMSLTFISDFNIEALSRLVANSPAVKGITCNAAPFGQVHQSLAQLHKQKPWGAAVWTLPERTIQGFATAFNLEYIDHESVLAEVDAFAKSLIAAAGDTTLFVASWVLPIGFSGYGPLDWRPELGLKNLLARMNLRLAEKLAIASNIYMLDTDSWLAQIAAPLSPKMWYAAKVPFASKVFEKAAGDIISAIVAIKGLSRRLIVLDLDNTLWGGVIGETGWQGIRLGGHDHIGEAYKEFQKELKALSNRGIQLAIVSKNDENVALEALDNHGEMLLKRNDFAGWRINWHDKAANIVSLVEDIGLGLTSVVFIDDNPAERDRVANALPAVFVPEWPQDPTAYVTALRALSCFHPNAISKEDRDRKAMYVAERARKDVQQGVDSPEEWLKRLGTRLYISRLNTSNVTRITQLFNKTNQLNLSTRRLSESEILAWAQAPNHSLLAFSASDHFGDMGLVGIIGVEANGKQGTLTDFILSCRVMGRKVEETMLHLAACELVNLGADTMKIYYKQTARNRPTLDVLLTAGLAETEPHHFEINAAAGFPKPETVALDFATTAAP